MVGLARTIFRLLNDKSKDLLKKEICDETMDFECFKKQLNRIRQRRIVYGALILFGANRKSVFLIKNNLEEILESLEKNEKYVILSKDMFRRNSLLQEIDSIFVPKKLTLSEMVESKDFVLVLRVNNDVFLAVSKDLAGALRNKVLTFPPYLMKRILESRSSQPVIRLVYNVRGDITGVEHVEEIEIRGHDVLRGFPKLIARLDVFKGIVSLFGPVIQVEYADRLNIKFNGEITYEDIESVVDVLRII